MKEIFGPVSKGLAGGLATAVAGNATMATLGADTPWYGIIIMNAIYLAFGFAAVYFAPRNTSS